jgi:hypothetical protein
MRKLQAPLFLAVAACGAHVSAPLSPSASTTYSCGDSEMVLVGGGVTVREPAASLGGNPTSIAPRLGWRDDHGSHFVTWPLSPIERTAVEYVVPADPRLDATRVVYDATSGYSTADWRAVDRRACVARGGYNDALARFVKGESFEQVARELALGSSEDARKLVHHALMAVQRRYWRDR